jgi:DNA-binding response OmpR family regulator
VAVKTVLVCDDEPVLRALIRESLSEGDFQVVEAEDGDEALRKARAARPDVILLDMMMPGRSGLDVLDEIRGDAELATVPVIMLTARTQAADRDAIAAAGADRYLAKPFSPRELVSVVEAVLDNGR